MVVVLMLYSCDTIEQPSLTHSPGLALLEGKLRRIDSSTGVHLTAHKWVQTCRSVDQNYTRTDRWKPLRWTRRYKAKRRSCENLNTNKSSKIISVKAFLLVLYYIKFISATVYSRYGGCRLPRSDIFQIIFYSLAPMLRVLKMFQKWINFWVPL